MNITLNRRQIATIKSVCQVLAYDTRCFDLGFEIHRVGLACRSPAVEVELDSEQYALLCKVLSDDARSRSATSEASFDLSLEIERQARS